MGRQPGAFLRLPPDFAPVHQHRMLDVIRQRRDLLRAAQHWRSSGQETAAGGAIDGHPSRPNQIEREGRHPLAGDTVAEEGGDVGEPGEIRGRKLRITEDRQPGMPRGLDLLLALAGQDHVQPIVGQVVHRRQDRQGLGVLQRLLRQDDEKLRQPLGRRGHRRSGERRDGVGDEWRPLKRRKIDEVRLSPDRIGHFRPRRDRRLPLGETTDDRDRHIGAKPHSAQRHHRVLPDAFGSDQDHAGERDRVEIGEERRRLVFLVALQLLGPGSIVEDNPVPASGELRRDEELGVKGLVGPFTGLDQDHAAAPVRGPARAVNRARNASAENPARAACADRTWPV